VACGAHFHLAPFQVFKTTPKCTKYRPCQTVVKEKYCPCHSEVWIKNADSPAPAKPDMLHSSKTGHGAQEKIDPLMPATWYTIGISECIFLRETIKAKNSPSAH
jgi:hypothetical protein